MLAYAVIVVAAVVFYLYLKTRFYDSFAAFDNPLGRTASCPKNLAGVLVSDWMMVSTN